MIRDFSKQFINLLIYFSPQHFQINLRKTNLTRDNVEKNQTSSLDVLGKLFFVLV